MAHLPPELTTKQSVSFSKALADPDSFTLFYELVHNEEPLRVPVLCKTFGAPGSDVSRLLSRLVHLGIAEKRGFAYAASEWAADALHFLEGSLSSHGCISGDKRRYCLGRYTYGLHFWSRDTQWGVDRADGKRGSTSSPSVSEPVRVGRDRRGRSPRTAPSRCDTGRRRVRWNTK